MDASPFRPYERLVRIKVLGKTVRVPEKNMLLRCFQYLSPETIPYGRFCWNQECQTCRVAYRLPGDPGEARQVLSCKVIVQEGMEITELSSELSWNLKKTLRRTRKAKICT
ncbi:MAG: 2Fe-2S iron-sulfur cluster-binding protein [Terriglobia bacterium]